MLLSQLWRRLKLVGVDVTVCASAFQSLARKRYAKGANVNNLLAPASRVIANLPNGDKLAIYARPAENICQLGKENK